MTTQLSYDLPLELQAGILSYLPLYDSVHIAVKYPELRSAVIDPYILSKMQLSAKDLRRLLCKMRYFTIAKKIQRQQLANFVRGLGYGVCNASSWGSQLYVVKNTLLSRSCEACKPKCIECIRGWPCRRSHKCNQRKCFNTANDIVYLKCREFTNFGVIFKKLYNKYSTLVKIALVDGYRRDWIQKNMSVILKTYFPTDILRGTFVGTACTYDWDKYM